MFPFSRETPELNLFMSTFCHYRNLHLWEKHFRAAVDEPFIRKILCKCLSARVLHEYMLSSFEIIAGLCLLVVALICGCRSAVQDSINSGLQGDINALCTC